MNLEFMFMLMCNFESTNSGIHEHEYGAISTNFEPQTFSMCGYTFIIIQADALTIDYAIAKDSIELANMEIKCQNYI